MIKKVEITDYMLISARKKAVSLGTLNNSILKGAGNLAGFLGEYIVASYLGATIENTQDYDLILHNGLKIDVKTKQTGVEPQMHYDCSVSSHNIDQKCDIYVFARVLKNFSCGWILGYMYKSEYYDNSIYMKKGEIDISNNYKVKSNCYNMKIYEINNIDDLKK